MYFDAHNHLQDAVFVPEIEALLQTLETTGVKGVMINGTEESDWARVLELQRRRPWLRASLGLHPWDVGNATTHWRDALTELLQTHPDVHLGEVGLDRWILERAAPDDPRLAGLARASLEKQADALTWQLELAHRLGRRASLHCIDAWEETRELLSGLRHRPASFLLHAYSGPTHLIGTFAELGAYFSFSPAFLDPKRSKRLESFNLIPRERLLVETDAPAMAPPEPWRTHKFRSAGSREVINHPGNIEAAYQGLAAHLGIPLTELQESAAEAFKRLFP